jgi:hypothetical protein
MKTRKLTFYADPDHGWLEVDRCDLDALGISDKVSKYSYTIGEKVYLEEDCDAGLFVETAKSNGWTINTQEIYQENLPIRNYQRFQIKKLIGA